MSELQRRQEAVLRFVATAIHGDVPSFLDNLPALDWPGAFRDVFAALVPVGQVHPAIVPAFVQAWRGEGDSRPLGINWQLGRDLQSHPALYVAGLRLLTPSYQDSTPPTVLYRGQSLVEHRQGRHGPWWTPFPHIAEWFARSEVRDHTGQRCIVAAFDPAPAIVSQLNENEFLLDAAQLDHVELIATPEPYTPTQEHQDLSTTTILDRVPHGYAAWAVREWRERLRQVPKAA